MYYDFQKRKKLFIQQQEAVGLLMKTLYCELRNRLLDICYTKFMLRVVNINYLANHVEKQK
jgi:hypothetical protein